MNAGRRAGLLLCAAILTLAAPAEAASGSGSAWRTFFAVVLPAAVGDFRSLRGAYDPRESSYAVKTRLAGAPVKECQIFQTGAGDSHAWQLRCALSSSAEQAAGPATEEGPLTRAIGAAIPAFKRGKNIMGEPQWKGAHGVAVTIVFGGILITHGYSDV